MVLPLLVTLALSSNPDPEREQRKPDANMSPTRGISGNLDLGVGFGPALIFTGGPAWLKAGLHIGYEFAPIDTRFRLALSIPIRMAGSSQRGAFNTTVDTLGVEILPGVRGILTVVPHLRLYADVGLGVTAYQFTAHIGNTTGSGSSAGFAFRFGFGLEYAVLDFVYLFAEPVGLLFQTAESSSFTWNGFESHSNVAMPIQWPMSFGVLFRI